MLGLRYTILLIRLPIAPSSPGRGCMFLNIKEMEVRRIRFDETFEPGQIDFSDTGLRQITGVHAEGSAGILENSGGEGRVQRRVLGTFAADCDALLATTPHPPDKTF